MLTKIKKSSLIQESSNRIVYDGNDGYVYKVAKNKLGYESNKNECLISKKDKEYFVETTKLSSKANYKVVKAKKIIINEDLNDLDKEFINYFGMNKKETNYYLERFYMLNKEYRINNQDILLFRRMVNSRGFNQNFINFKNTLLRYNLEPGDVMAGITFINNKPIIYDFGLTERTFFNNMFSVCFIYNNKLHSVIHYIKSYKNHYKERSFIRNNDYGMSAKLFIKEYFKSKPVNNKLFYDMNKKTFITYYYK